MSIVQFLEMNSDKVRRDEMGVDEVFAQNCDTK